MVDWMRSIAEVPRMLSAATATMSTEVKTRDHVVEPSPPVTSAAP